MSDAADADLNRTRLRLQSLDYKVQEHRLEKAWTRIENAGFEPILIKGWAAAQLYPNPAERRFNDIDLIIAPRRYDEAVGFVKTLGNGSGVDLHCNAKKLDTLSFENLYARSRILMCGATPIRVLCQEDHLRVLCVHWLRESGAKKEKLLDVFYAVENRPAGFDWERCLDAAGRTRREWVACVVGLAHIYFGLNIENTPLAKEAEEVPGWLIKAVERHWRSGTINLKPLSGFFEAGGFPSNSAEFWRQIKKRIPPDPILATVDLEGRFNSRRRHFYQAADLLVRFRALLKKILKPA